MSFTTFTNIITILFCLAVLIQSVRMMRSLSQVRNARLDDTVVALNTATAQAQAVLSGLRETLANDGAANARTLSQAKDLREELNVLIGIANAMAERLVDAASQPAELSAGPADPRETRARARKTPTRKSAAQAKQRDTASQRRASEVA